MATRLTRISALSSSPLMNLLVAMSKWDRETKKQIRQRTKAMVQPAWQAVVSARASTPLESRVLAASARAQVSDQNITLRAATSRRALEGGLRPAEGWQAVEFGAEIRGTRRRSPKGRVTRVMTGRQFKRPNRKGYVFYPSAADIIPRVASLWVQTAVRTFHELREGANR